MSRFKLCLRPPKLGSGRASGLNSSYLGILSLVQADQKDLQLTHLNHCPKKEICKLFENVRYCVPARLILRCNRIQCLRISALVCHIQSSMNTQYPSFHSLRHVIHTQLPAAIVLFPDERLAEYRCCSSAMLIHIQSLADTLRRHPLHVTTFTFTLVTLLELLSLLHMILSFRDSA